MFTGSKGIRVKTLCMFRQDDFIFVSKMFDSVKNDFYYRPIGGTNEFGEDSKTTIVREIKEELNTEISITKLIQVIENIFICDGLDGHEVVFLYEGKFTDEKFYEKKEYKITESNGEKIPAYWIRVDEFKNGRLRLVPELLSKYID